MTTNPYVVETSGLTKRFGSRTVVQDDVHEAEHRIAVTVRAGVLLTTSGHAFADELHAYSPSITSNRGYPAMSTPQEQYSAPK